MKRAITGPRANKAAFLLLERERRAVAARLRHADRRRSERYRDLVLITKLIRLEYEYLIGQVGRETRLRSLPDGPPSLGEDRPADWAEPWSAALTFELRQAFDHCRHQRDRLARRLSAATRASVAADAERQLERIVISNLFEGVTDERRPELEDDRALAPKSQGQDARPLMAAAAGDQATAEEARPWASNWFTWAAATAGVVLLVAGVDVAIQSGGPSDSTSVPGSTSARVPERPLAALGGTSRETQSARDRAAGHGAPKRSSAPEQPQSDAVGVQPVSTPSPAPEAAPAPSSAASPVVAPSPAPAPVTAVASATPAPATAPQQEFGFED